MNVVVSEGTTLATATLRIESQPRPLSRRKLPRYTAYSSGIFCCTVRSRQFSRHEESFHSPMWMLLLPMSMASRPDESESPWGRVSGMVYLLVERAIKPNVNAGSFILLPVGKGCLARFAQIV